MRRRAVVAAIGLFAVVGAGCAETGSDRDKPANSAALMPGTGGGAPVAAAAAPDPCEGAVGECAQVAQADVDGDGSLDRVAVAVSKHEDSGATVEVRVGRAGSVDEISFEAPVMLQPGDGAPADYFVGAYKLSRTTGADVVVHLVPGRGNADQFGVVAWSGGELEVVPQPPRQQAGAQPDPEGRWLFQSSHGVVESVKCSPSGGAITVQRLSAATAEGVEIPGGGLREDNRFEFRDSDWFPTGSDNVPDTSFSYTFDAHTQTFDCASVEE